MATTFHARLLWGTEKDTLGIIVPDEVVEALGGGGRPAVTVRIGTHTYRSTVARMGGQYLVGVAKAHRSKAGITDQQSIDVTLTLDTAKREVEVPADLKAALEEAGVSQGWAKLAPSAKKEFVRQVTTAKKEDTRARRVQKAVDAARERQP